MNFENPSDSSWPSQVANSTSTPRLRRRLGLVQQGSSRRRLPERTLRRASLLHETSKTEKTCPQNKHSIYLIASCAPNPSTNYFCTVLVFLYCGIILLAKTSKTYFGSGPILTSMKCFTPAFTKSSTFAAHSSGVPTIEKSSTTSSGIYFPNSLYFFQSILA
jgi:hypothetical protein